MKNFINKCNNLKFDVLSEAVDGLKNYLSFIFEMKVNTKNNKPGKIGDKKKCRNNDRID